MIVLKKTSQLTKTTLETLAKGANHKEQQLFDNLRNLGFAQPGEGFFIAEVAGEIIGMGSIQQSPHSPPTAGIALLSNCYIIPTARRKGYGNQLYKQLVQFAKIHFDLLQLSDDCPLKGRKEELIDLRTI